MNVPEREIIFLAKLSQPVVGRVVVHRVSVSRDEKPVAFKPLCSELYAFFVLLRFVLLQNINAVVTASSVGPLFGTINTPKPVTGIVVLSFRSKLVMQITS